MKQTIHPKKSSRVRTLLFAFIFLVGLGILAFPIVSQIAYHLAAQVKVQEFTKGAAQIDHQEIDQRMALAEAYNASLLGQASTGQVAVLEDPYSEEEEAAGRAEYARMLEVKEQIGTVFIPKISQKLPIYAGTSESVLQQGVGHLEGTSLPIGGEPSHSVLTAHRGLPNARLFTDLDRLKVGDRFFVENIKETLAYEVDQVEVIEPHEVEQLGLVSNGDYVTLLTCTPYMINSHRLLVRGHRIPYHAGLPEEEEKKGGLWQEWLAYLVGGLLVLLVFYVIWRRRKRKREAVHARD